MGPRHSSPNGVRPPRGLTGPRFVLLLFFLGLARPATTRARDYWFAPPDWPGPTTETYCDSTAQRPFRYPKICDWNHDGVPDRRTPEGHALDGSSIEARAYQFALDLGWLLGGNALWNCGVPDSDTNLVVYFHPGVYPTTTIRPNIDTGRSIHRLRLVLARAPGATGEVVLKQLLAPRWYPVDPVRRYQYATLLHNEGPWRTNSVTARLEVENLTLDVNWDGLHGYVEPSHNGFKAQGIYWTGRTGRLRGVRVVHSGANGLVPRPATFRQGTECFPISIVAADFREPPAPGSGDPTAWVIEDCEVSDLHLLRGGYFTAIMATAGFPSAYEQDPARPGTGTPDSPIPETLRAAFRPHTHWYQVVDQPPWRDHRVVTVRRCLVSGRGGAAFGGAGSSGISFHDNVVVNTDNGGNWDTRRQRNLDLTNSVYLDTSMGIGTLGAWSGFSYGRLGYRHLTVAGNLVRLARRAWSQDYADHYERPGGTLVPDPNLIGRFLTNEWCAGLSLGSSSDVRITGNRFTTRPAPQFFEPSPGQLDESLFRPCYRPSQSDQQATPEWEDNTISRRAYDFLDLRPLGRGGTAFHLQQALGRPPAVLPEDARFGTVGRVRRVWEGGPGSRLIGVQEVSITEPAAVPEGARIDIRWLHHPTPLDRRRKETEASSPAPIRVRVEGPDGRVRTGWRLETNGDLKRLFLPKDWPDGLHRVIGFVPAAQSEAPFDPRQDAWSETEWITGTTVRFAPDNDVAQEESGRPGRLRLRRTGTKEITVRLRQLTGTGRNATHGKDADFTLRGPDGREIAPGPDGLFKVDFPRGGPSEQVIELVPVRDHLAEAEAAVFALQDGPGYTAIPSVVRPGGSPLRATPGYSATPAELQASCAILILDAPP